MTSNYRLALVACLALTAGTALAQDNLFDEAPGLFDPQPAPTQPAAGETETDDDPLVRQLMEHAARGDLQLADAIASLARLGKWTEVDRLLARTAGKTIDDEMLAQMFGKIGPTLYLRIKQRTDLSGSAQAGMDKLQKAATAYAQSENRLKAAVEQLGSPSTDEQLQGTRTLMSGGDASVKVLVDAAVAEQPSDKRDNILRTLLALGGGGTDALRQLALYGTPEVRVRALQSLARISRRDHVVDLVAAWHATDATAEERQLAETQLNRLSGVPTREATVEALALDLRRHHDEAQRIENDGGVVTLWSTNENRDGVIYQPALAMHAGYREVYDSAARLRRMGTLPPDLDAATLAVAIGYQLMLDPDWGDADQVQAIRDRYASQLQGEALSNVMTHALATDDHAATIGLIRLIDPATITDAERVALLQGSAGVAAPLVQAAWSAEPRVRYEAALKVAQLAGESPYAGSSQVLRTLSEMHRLNDKPTVILVETRPDTIIPIEGLLRNLGLHVEIAATVGEAQRLVALGGDLRLVLAKNQLADLSAIELIDTVRRMNRGRRLPIAVFGDDVPYLGDQRWDAPTSWIEGPVTLSSLDELLNLTQRSRRLPPLTLLDRQSYRQAADDLLGVN